jgi:hypothetical protein
MTDKPDPAKEYLRKRRVWRYLNDLPGPAEPPTEEDKGWLKSAWGSAEE